MTMAVECPQATINLTSPNCHYLCELNRISHSNSLTPALSSSSSVSPHWIVGNSASASVHRLYTRNQNALWVKSSERM